MSRTKPRLRGATAMSLAFGVAALVNATPARADEDAAEPPAPPPPAEPAAPPIARAADAPAPTLGPRLSVEAGATMIVSLMPSLRPGASAAAFLEGRAGPRAYLALDLLAGQKVLIDDRRGVSMDLLRLSLGACPLAFATPTGAFGACLGGSVGRVAASGFGFDQSSDDTRWTAGLGGGLYARQRVAGSLYLAASVQVEAPLGRFRFTFVDTDGKTKEIFQPGPIGGAAQIRAGYTFE